MATASSFTALPDDVLQRVLLGVLLDDHLATAAACRAFRDVIRGPRFLRLRREYGFAGRSMILVGQRTGYVRAPKEIFVLGKRGAVTSVPEGMHLEIDGSTTDGGARLFFSTTPRDWTNLILAVNGSTRRWSRFATLPPHQVLHCIEWHDGLLYACGGFSSAGNTHSYLNTFRAFDETTGLWEDLPPMPHACANAASGVIGNELFIAGGLGVGNEYLSTLQIYDFTARTWRLGVPLPQATHSGCGVVTDGKLYLVESKYSVFQSMMVYDVQSNTWTEQQGPPNQNAHGAPPPQQGYGGGGYGAPPPHRIMMNAFAHNGRVVTVNMNRTAFQRGSGDPDWSRFELDVVPGIIEGVAGSVILG